MARKRVYPPEFQAKILELVRSGRSANSIAREAGRRSDGLATAESLEVAKLRKKVRELEIERDLRDAARPLTRTLQ
jgi:transposase